MCSSFKKGFFRARLRAFPLRLRIFRIVERQSCKPDLDGVARAARVAFVSFEVARRSRLSTFRVTLIRAPNRGLLVKRSVPVFALARVIISRQVDRGRREILRI